MIPRSDSETLSSQRHGTRRSVAPADSAACAIVPQDGITFKAAGGVNTKGRYRPHNSPFAAGWQPGEVEVFARNTPLSFSIRG